MERSARVQREYLRYVPKYERYEKRTSSYNVHAPPCLNVQVGDRVRVTATDVAGWAGTAKVLRGVTRRG